MAVLAAEVGPVRAAGPFTLIDGPSAFVFDATPTGKVLTGGFGVAKVVDLVTGEDTVLPAEAAGARRLGRGGAEVYFSTTDQLVGEDTDGDSDVYAYVLSTATYRLVSRGNAGWSFSLNEFTSTGGDARDDGTVVFTGVNGSFATAGAFFAGDTGDATQLGTSLGSLSSAEAYGIADNGNVLFRAGSDLYVQNISGSAPVQVNLGAAAGKALWTAKISADGGHVAIVAGSPMTVYLRHIAAATTVTIGAFDSGLIPALGLGINADGTVVSLLRNATVVIGGTPMDAPSLFLWKAGTVTEVSAPTGGRPTGQADGGFVMPDGVTVYFNSQADNLVDGIDTSVDVHNVYVNKAKAKATPSPTPVWGDPSAFTPRSPLRILDTRPDGPLVGYTGDRPGVGTIIPVALHDHFGVPADATAAVVQVTATGGSGVGYVGVTPSGSPADATSTLNLDVAGETIANMAVVPIGSDGKVNVFTSTPTHVIVDLMGWWTPAPGAVSAGRFVPVATARVLDTRPTSLVGYSGPKPGPNTTTVIEVAGHAGVPPSGVTAVSVNITLDQTAAPGFVQAGPAATLVPGASSTLNVSSAGQVIAAATIVPVDSEGRIALFNQSSTHLIVDVNGWFTDGTAPASTSGLFVPATAVTRTLDTRPSESVGYLGPLPAASTTISMPATGAALVGNLTVTETASAGFLQLGPLATLVPGATSNINITRTGETLANGFISPVDAHLGVFFQGRAQVIVDVGGYMTS